MVRRAQDEYGWEFLFLGANMDAIQAARSFGIREERAVRFENDSRGTALNCRVETPTYDGGVYGPTPCVEAICLHRGDELTVLAVNRSLTEDGELTLDLRGFGTPELTEHRQLWHEDLKAVNTAGEPENVAPSAGDGRTLRRHSWNVLRYRLK